MGRNNFPSVLGVLGVLLLLTTGVVLYARGFRLDLTQRVVTTTGIILVKSVPDGARVHVDGELAAATDSTITGIKEGVYNLKIEKEGYVSWEKIVEVKEGMVTNITALLTPLSPSFTAITQNGAELVTSAPSGTKAVFISGNKLYLLPLNNQFLGFLRTRPQEIAKESEDMLLSKSTELIFSPNENQILVKAAGKYFLITIGQGEAQLVSNPTKLIKDWESENLDHRTEVVADLEVPSDLKDIALSEDAYWAPDERKLLYVKTQGEKREFWVANFSDPLPVGERINQKILETKNSKINLFWLADSNHFVLLNGKTVSLIDLDGSNKRDLYNGELAERIALSSTDLAQVIVLTSLSPNSGSNLYGISLR